MCPHLLTEEYLPTNNHNLEEMMMATMMMAHNTK